MFSEFTSGLKSGIQEAVQISVRLQRKLETRSNIFRAKKKIILSSQFKGVRIKLKTKYQK